MSKQHSPRSVSGSERPTSTASTRTAWEDPEMYDNDPETAKQVPDPFDNEMSPSAMESEVFDKDGAVRIQQRYNQKEEPKGCWYKFKKGIRSIWQTKHTEDTKYDRELYIKTTLRELIIYTMFLILLCIITFGMTSTTMFYFTKVMSELFLDSQDDNGKTFRTITQMDDFWGYVEGPLMRALYWEKWYNKKSVTADQLGFIFYENKLLGLPRLRMLQVRNDSCSVPEAFEREIKECFGAYSGGREDRQPFGPQNSTAWVYHQSESGSFWGQISTYGGDGYVQELKLTKNETQPLITILKQNRWVTRGTRVIFIDFTVYNANVNLFCVVKLILEFPATGGVLPSFEFRTLKLIRYVSTFDYFVLSCEGIFCAFIIYYIVEELIEVQKWRLSYFKSFWNILDVIVITLALFCIAFTIYRQLSVEKKLDELLNQPDRYANFEFIAYAQTRFNDMIAVMVFFAWIKIFKYISFNKTMNQLSSTLSRCAKDVGGFAIMFFIFFFAYAQLGYLLFGTQVKDFSTFYDAVFTLLRTILGDFDFHELETANRVLGPIFFITYVFFVFFVLLNMFLAIINDTYAEVKAELATQKNEFELADYFRRGYYNMLRKMNIKKDKIVDIQAALGNADSDHNKQVDFDEWRDHLKARGYADQEIEAMFTKYDLDGDKVLDEEEQRRMQLDLEGEGLDIGEGPVSDEPPTARSRFEDFNSGPPVVYGGGGGRGGGGKGGISVEEFHVMGRRVDRMELSIGNVVTKIDAAINRLEILEKQKLKHRERLARALTDVDKMEVSDEVKVENIKEAVNTEMDRYDQDTGADAD